MKYIFPSLSKATLFFTLFFIHPTFFTSKDSFLALESFQLLSQSYMFLPTCRSKVCHAKEMVGCYRTSLSEVSQSVSQILKPQNKLEDFALAEICFTHDLPKHLYSK